MDVILGHVNVDFDALASMVAAKKLYPEAVMVFAGAVNRNVREFIALHGDVLEFMEPHSLVIIYKSTVFYHIASKITGSGIYQERPVTIFKLTMFKQIIITVYINASPGTARYACGGSKGDRIILCTDCFDF